MPDFPIIDAHLHIWDPERYAISWQADNAAMARPFSIEDYAEDTRNLNIEAMVFVEAFVDRGGFLQEVRFVEEAAARDPRLRAIVANAPLEDGEDARPFLEHLQRHHPLVVGTRRMIEFQPDPDFATRPDFVRGVQMLREFDMSFDVNVHHTQMDMAAALADAVEDVPLILDHCGKPGIRDGTLEPWRTHLRRFAENPDACCKLSDLPVEADWQAWTIDDLRPYVDTVIGIFGFDRLIYATDWPVCTQATSPKRWNDVLDKCLTGTSTTDLRKLYADNARRIYRIS